MSWSLRILSSCVINKRRTGSCEGIAEKLACSGFVGDVADDRGDEFTAGLVDSSACDLFVALADVRCCECDSWAMLSKSLQASGDVSESSFSAALLPKPQSRSNGFLLVFLEIEYTKSDLGC